MAGARIQNGSGDPRGRDRLAKWVHRQPLFLLALAGGIGIFLESYGWGLSPSIWVLLAVTSLAAAIWIPPAIRWLMILLAVVSVFALRQHQCDQTFTAASVRSIARPSEQPVVVKGSIDRPVVLKRHPLADQRLRDHQSPWQSRLELELQSLRVRSQFVPCRGRVMVVCDGDLDHLKPGDQLTVFGNLRSFAGPTNPGQRDLRFVYQTRGLHGRIDVDLSEQVIVSDTPHNHLWRPIATIASYSRELLLRHTSETSGPLAVALVIGQRDFVDPQIRDQLIETGTAHLLSVSGMHLAIVVGLVAGALMLLPVPYRFKLILTLVACLAYTAITGARPPVMRAAVLVITVLASLWLRRPAQPLNTLALAALLLLAIQPSYLFSVGVQLSFLAVATLLLSGGRQSSVADLADAQREARLQELIDRASFWPWRWVRWILGLTREAFRFSFCVAAVSTPLVWYHFHVISLIAVVTNVVLSPILVVALGAGVVTVITGWIADPLARWPGGLCDWSLQAIGTVIETAAAIPGGHFWMPSPPAWWVMVFYLVLIASLWYANGKKIVAVRIGWIAVWFSIAVPLSIQPAPLPADTIEATFVDVGHGTSVVIRHAPDDVWLYDCGRLGNDAGTSRDIDGALWSLGVRRLRGVYLSHADADHYNALPSLIRRFRIDQVITPPGFFHDAPDSLLRVEALLRSAGIPIRQISAADSASHRGDLVAVLHPPPQRIPGSDNANSLVLRIDHGGKSLLLPGDLEAPGTRWVLDAQRPPPGGVLMAPHHGSTSKQSDSVVAWARPRETIVSGGRRARRPEVATQLASNGSGVHVTAAHGAIRVRIGDDGGVQLWRWNDHPW